MDNIGTDAIEQFRILTGGKECPEAIKQWVAMMDDHWSSRCTLYNIFWGEPQAGNLDREHILSFFARLEDHITSEGIPLSKPEDLVQTLADKPETLYMKGRPANLRKDRPAKVMSVRSFAKRLLSLDTAISDVYWEQQVADSINKGKYYPSDLSGTLRTDRPICWVTKYDEVRTIAGSLDGDACATALRDRLGLEQFGRAGVLLVELDYPESASILASLVFAMPTVFDAGSHPVFAPNPSQPSDGWGRAIDIKNMTVGMCEAVHGECSVSRHFSFRFIGKVTEERSGVYESLFKYLRERRQGNPGGNS